MKTLILILSAVVGQAQILSPILTGLNISGGGGSGWTPTFVQSAQCTNSSGTHACGAFSMGNVTSGNKLIAIILTGSGPFTASVPTSALGNTFTQTGSCHEVTIGGTFLVFEATVTTGGAETITMNSVSQTYDGWTGEYTPGTISSALDQIACAGGSGASLSSGATSATTAANELVIGFGGATKWRVCWRALDLPSEIRKTQPD